MNETITRTYVFDYDTAKELLEKGHKIIDMVLHKDDANKKVYIFEGDLRKEKEEILNRRYPCRVKK